MAVNINKQTNKQANSLKRNVIKSSYAEFRLDGFRRLTAAKTLEFIIAKKDGYH